MLLKTQEEEEAISDAGSRQIFEYQEILWMAVFTATERRRN
jgi:hypothetical protein